MNLTALLADAAGGSHFVELALSIDSVTPGACPPGSASRLRRARAGQDHLGSRRGSGIGLPHGAGASLTIALDGDVEYEPPTGNAAVSGLASRSWSPT